MTTPLIDLLQQIASGVTIYEPYPRTSQALVEFQDLVHRLQEMERLGLVTKVWTQTKESGGSEYYDMAMVTPKGSTLSCCEAAKASG